MNEMIEVAQLREGDTFEYMGGKLSVVRIWGKGETRTVHLEAWPQGQGAELKLRGALKVRLTGRMSDPLLKLKQDERREATLASLGALFREVDEAPDAEEPPCELFGSCADPDEPEWTDEDLETNTVTNAQERLAALIAERDAALRERDQARAEVASLEAQAEQDERYASGLEDRPFELKHSDDMRALALRDQHAQIAALTAERDAARADLARYTAVYGDPDAPVDVSSFAVGKPDAPLRDHSTPFTDADLAAAIAAAPAVKVGDRVRCDALGGITGTVETIDPETPVGVGCLVRDDAHGHVWGAASWILEVLP